MISTIKEVAERAGVSISTVSKVLKNYSNISEDTRQKVLKAVKELNYIPNTTASALYICINDMKQAVDEINMLYLQGAFAMANINHLELVTIFNQMVSSMSAQELTSYLAAQGITGIIIYGLNKEDYKILQLIEQQRFNICVIDAPITNDKTSSVMIDHMKGQYDVAKAIIEPEYTRKVLYLAGKRNGYVTDMRIQVIMQLQKELGFELNIQYAEFSEKLAYDLTLRYGSDVDTVVCASDLMAIGALNALIKMNIYRKCCGFDGITLMRYAGKGMLTCKQDFYDISRHAIAVMERLLSGENGRSVILDHQIVSIRYEDINTK